MLKSIWELYCLGNCDAIINYFRDIILVNNNIPPFRAEGDRNGVGELVDAGGEPAAAGLAGRYNLDVCPHHQAAAGDDPGRPGQPLQG